MDSGEQVQEYRTGDALWRAVKDRIKQRVRADARVTSAGLQRQFVYDRFLTRVFTASTGQWVLKGGTALLVRIRSARHSQDIDLFRRSGDVELAIQELQAAAAVDLGDHFRFEMRVKNRVFDRPGQPGTELVTLHVDTYIDVSHVAEFTVDVVVGSIVTGEPEITRPAPTIELAGLVSCNYLLYPIADHVADKVCATFELHPPYATPSSRVRDLVDLVVIARTQDVDAGLLTTAIETERISRNLPTLARYTTPPGWRTTYASNAARVAECRDHRSYDSALALAQALLDPVLDGTRTAGRWESGTLSWPT